MLLLFYYHHHHYHILLLFYFSNNYLETPLPEFIAESVLAPDYAGFSGLRRQIRFALNCAQTGLSKQPALFRAMANYADMLRNYA